MSRLWFLVGEKKFVYVSFTGDPINGNYQELLELFGIRNDQLTLINRPDKFKSIVVVQTSYLRPFSYSNEYQFVFQQIIDNLKNEKVSYPDIDTIFWTRRKFKDAKRKKFGEENIEQLFKKNGYKVLAPEIVPLKEQIYYFHSCKKWL